MKRRLIRLVLLSMSVVMGWAFGFIKAPYVKDNYSFWVGFAGCIGMIVFVAALFRIWNNNKVLELFEPVNSSEIGIQRRRITKMGMLLSIIFLVLVLLCILSYFTIQRIRENLNLVNVELNEVKYNANLEQQRIKISLLLDLINKLDSSKMKAQDKSAVDEMIDRITTLSTSLKIHKDWDIENKVFQPLSSERGLLLLALVKTKMDSNFFKKIKDNVSFYGADLRNADFHNLNLSGIDLRYANLDYANLRGVNLNTSNLKGASLIRVDLNQASLIGANLIKAKLNWAKINDADLQRIALDSADLSNATLQKSKLINAKLMYAILYNTVFYEADLSSSHFKITNVSNTNLSKSVLTNVHISRTNFGVAILNDAIIQKNWITQLTEKDNSGANTILEKYEIICDSITIQDSCIYRLTPKIH